jgi:imidazolonepropionase-like amidohydrolase
MNFARTALVFLAASGFAVPETKVLKNFMLIDGAGGRPLAGAAMIIADGRIRWVGPASGLKPPPGAETVDLTGRFVMPGIINLHSHLGTVVDLVEDQGNFTRENIEKQLRTYASYGVTAVLSMGTDQDLIYQIRAEQRAGRPGMTRIFTAGRGFKGKGGYPNTPATKGIPFEVTTPQEAEKAVAQLGDKGVDVVKIWVDDHLGRQPKIPMDLCRSIISSANKHGLKVAAHVFYLEDARQLVEAGLHGLAHSIRDAEVDSALIAAMKKRGAWQSAATLSRELSTFVYAKPQPFLDEPFFTRSVSPQVVAALKSSYREKIAADPDLPKYPGFLDTAKRNLKKLADAGVRFGFGTDTGPPGRFSGYFEHREMELMAEAGLTPIEVITAATGSSAEFLGVAKHLGTLEAGKWADLIVLRGDPLENIANTRSIEAVWIAGNRVN